MEQVIWWGDGAEEVLSHGDPNEAIEAHIDAFHPDPIEGIGEITMYEYAPMKPPVSACGSPLEYVLEMLDEEYGNPDGDSGLATPAMLDAEQAFLKTILDEYQPWACEQTGNKVTVNALEWTLEHRPDWLKQQSHS